MIVIRREDEISVPELLEGVNRMEYKLRRKFLKGVKLENCLHTNKVLLYGSANKLLEVDLEEHQKATLIAFYHKQIRFLERAHYKKLDPV